MSNPAINPPAAIITPALEQPALPAKINRIGLFGITAGHTSVDMQTGSLAVLLPLLLTQFNLSYGMAALIVSVNNLIIAVAQPLFGIMGDRKPMRWLMFVGCVLCGTAMVSVMFLPTYGLVIAAVVLSGIGSAMFHPEALSAMRDVSGDKPETGTSVFFFGGNLGFALGPLLATTLIAAAGKFGALGMIVPTVIGLVLLLSQRRLIARGGGVVKARSVAAQSQASSRRRVVWLVVFLLALIAIRSAILSGLQTFIPLYFDRYTSVPHSEVAMMVTVLIFTGAFGTLMGGTISERIGRRNTMCMAMVVVLAALLVFMRAEGVAQFVALGVAGAFITMPWPISVVMVQEAMPNNVGLASGLTLGLAYGASGLAVSLMGGMADVAGLPAVMTLITLLPIAVFGMSLFVPERAR
jgi:FSR family fosmidomycin resistance protein-like MFS transporter